MLKRAAVTAMVSVAAMALIPLVGTPASAASKKGCDYPYVCFYLTSADYRNSLPTAMYKDVTPAFQTLGSRSKGARAFVNTRNDDRVSIRYTEAPGTQVYTACIPPNESWPSIAPEFTVLAVRIENSSTCPGV